MPKQTIQDIIIKKVKENPVGKTEGISRVVPETSENQEAPAAASTSASASSSQASDFLKGFKEAKREKEVENASLDLSGLSEPPKRNFFTAFLSKFSKGKFVFGIVIFFIALIVGAKVLNSFSKAVVMITLHKEEVSVDALIKAGDGAEFDIPLHKMEASFSSQKSTPVSGFEDAEESASGKIRVYNAYSSVAQPLVSGTRFETPEGKIYKTRASLTVPGAKISGGNIEPSSIDVIVYADRPGQEYNIGLSDFTIPGFKAGPRYDKFYARSVTPMEGGFIGKKPVISEEDLAKITNEVETEIKSEIMKKTKKLLPPDYFFFENSAEITFKKDNTPNENPDPNSPIFTLSETGTMNAFIILKKDFSSVLASKYLGEEFRDKVEIKNIGNLQIDIINSDFEKNTVSFNVKGEAQFVWLLDETKLKDALIASPKDMQKVFDQTSSIDKASVEFKPSWWKFFPNSASRVEIKVNQK